MKKPSGRATMEEAYEAIIIGGGPAGLSAALVLGRCRRRVLVCDQNQPRNARSHGIHAFHSRDGTPPGEMRRLALDQLNNYSSVTVREAEVLDVHRSEHGFTIAMEGGAKAHSRKLLLATGLRDLMPPIAGIEEFYGTSVHHCPICDGWEHQEKALVAYGDDEAAVPLALELLLWSPRVMLCTGGPTTFDRTQRQKLERNGIRLVQEAVLRAEGEQGMLRHLALEGGEKLECNALFFTARQTQAARFSEKLGCDHTALSEICCGDRYEVAGIQGLYAAGNCAVGAQLAIVAAAEGARAAQEIVNALISDYYG